MLTVLSWNVNSIKVRCERLLALLAREQPDVVCLQELKCLGEAFPTERLRTAGYAAAVFGQKAYNGVAILSKVPFTEVETGFGDAVSDPAARFIGATVKGVRIYSVYVPNGQAVGTEKYAYKLDWLKRLRAFLERRHHPTDPCLLLGDFNVAPEDRDIHDPVLWREKILCSTPERQALALSLEWGLWDTFRKHHSEANHFSWWDYRELAFVKNRGLRIDLILATAPLYERCYETAILRDERKGTQPSDHAPVVALFR